MFMEESKTKSIIDSFDKKFSISRRSFVKGAMAAGAATTLYGCSKDSGGDVIYGGGSLLKAQTRLQ